MNSAPPYRFSIPRPPTLVVVAKGKRCYPGLVLTLGTETIPLRRDEHGTIRVRQTRVSLESVAYCFEEGATAETIVEAFPTLSLSDVYLVLGYCLRHPQEVAEYLEEQRQLANEARESHERRFGFQVTGLRDRLLARQAQRNGK